MMKVVIIDDDIAAIGSLAESLAFYKDIELVGTAMNGNDGLKIINSVEPDLLFLDIEMPDMSGLDFLERMQNSSVKLCHVVIYTSYEEYMLPSFRNEAFDFLLKPVDKKELDIVMQRFYTDILQLHKDLKDIGIRKQSDSRLLFYVNNIDFRIVNVKNIGLFQHNQELRVWETVIAGREKPIRLKRCANNEALLKIDSSFVQVHQRYIININYLLEVTDNICHFYPPFDGINYVKVGRFYRKRLLSNFENV